MGTVQDPTTNYNWNIPEVGGDADAWGGILNEVIGDDVTGIDAIVKLVEDKADAAQATADGISAVDSDYVEYQDSQSAGSKATETTDVARQYTIIVSATTDASGFIFVDFSELGEAAVPDAYLAVMTDTVSEGFVSIYDVSNAGKTLDLKLIDDTGAAIASTFVVVTVLAVYKTA